MSQNMKVHIEDQYDEQAVISLQNTYLQPKINQNLSHPSTQSNNNIVFQDNQGIQINNQNKYTSQSTYNAEQSINFRKTQSYQVHQLNQYGDPPLLQDIGINPNKIISKFIIVAKMDTPALQIVQNPDLTGPILIAMVLGFLLLFSGKMHFGDIYAQFIIGNFLCYILFNLMTKNQVIPLYNIMSSLGYGLIPMIVLGLFHIVISLKSSFGIFLSLGMAIWASISASKFFQGLMKITLEENNKSIIIIYPLFLFYMCFAMIVIF